MVEVIHDQEPSAQLGGQASAVRGPVNDGVQRFQDEGVMTTLMLTIETDTEWCQDKSSDSFTFESPAVCTFLGVGL